MKWKLSNENWLFNRRLQAKTFCIIIFSNNVSWPLGPTPAQVILYEVDVAQALFAATQYVIAHGRGLLALKLTTGRNKNLSTHYLCIAKLHTWTKVVEEFNKRCKTQIRFLNGAESHQIRMEYIYVCVFEKKVVI